MTFLENGTKVYALNPKTFVFVPEKSAGNPEVDIIRTVNIPFVVRLCVRYRIMFVIIICSSQIIMSLRCEFMSYDWHVCSFLSHTIIPLTRSRPLSS